MPTCYFCGATAADTEAAIDAGWVPSFWEPGADCGPVRGEVSEPACGGCVRDRLAFNDEFQDYELIEQPLILIPPGHEPGTP